MLEKTLHILETAAIFHSQPAYNLPHGHVKKMAKISFLSARITFYQIPRRREELQLLSE
jgi:hypothetical protein